VIETHNKRSIKAPLKMRRFLRSKFPIEMEAQLTTYGYAHVSTTQQDFVAQVDALTPGITPGC